jgi:DNA-binding NarL/FixJ family response regulator
MGRYLLIDDHPLMREAMASLVRDCDPAGDLLQAGSLAEGRRLAATGTLDAAIIDLQLPDGDGGALVAEFRARWPALPILVLTATEDLGRVRALLASGATGFAPKSAGHATLSAALRLVLAGQTYVPPLVLGLPALQAAGAAPAADNDPAAAPEAGGGEGSGRLTPRQIEVLRLVCSGLPNKLISRQLGLAERTVKVHIGAVFRALGVSNRTQAAMVARDRGWLD